MSKKNGTLRQWCKRFTGSHTPARASGTTLKVALALHFAHYNFCRVHGSLGITPAMAAGITSRMEYPSYRKLIVVALAAAIPVELVALAGLRSIPIDVGYAPGTPYWIQALGLFGLLMHYPAFRANIPLPLLLATGYLESSVLVFLIALLVRALRAVSRL